MIKHDTSQVEKDSTYDKGLKRVKTHSNTVVKIQNFTELTMLFRVFFLK